MPWCRAQASLSRSFICAAAQAMAIWVTLAGALLLVYLRD
jgi:hypothetical protein